MRKSVSGLVRNLAAVAVLAVMSSGAAQAQTADPKELAAFKEAIGKKYAVKVQAFKEAKAEPIVTKFYGPDVISVSADPKDPAKPHVTQGREAFRKQYTEAFKGNGPTDIKIESVKTYVNGNAGWDLTNFIINPNGKSGESLEKGGRMDMVILFLWTKVNGEWMANGEAFIPGYLSGL